MTPVSARIICCHESGISLSSRLGSNLGIRAESFCEAMERLQQFSAAALAEILTLGNHASDCPPGSPMFVNAVVALVPKSGETPESLLAQLQALEKEFGRQAKKVLTKPALWTWT